MNCYEPNPLPVHLQMKTLVQKYAAAKADFEERVKFLEGMGTVEPIISLEEYFFYRWIYCDEVYRDYLNMYEFYPPMHDRCEEFLNVTIGPEGLSESERNVFAAHRLSGNGWENQRPGGGMIDYKWAFQTDMGVYKLEGDQTFEKIRSLHEALHSPTFPDVMGVTAEYMEVLDRKRNDWWELISLQMDFACKSTASINRMHSRTSAIVGNFHVMHDTFGSKLSQGIRDQRALAVVMSLHSRLGAQAPVGRMDEETMRMIVGFL